MRIARVVALALAVPLLFLACGDEEMTGPQISDLAGEWEADAFAYTDANEEFTMAIIRVGGEFTVTVQESGAFAATLSVPNPEAPGGLQDIPLSGTLSLQGDDMISIDFDAQTEALDFTDFTATYTLDGATLTWDADDVDFDFPMDNVDGQVPATLHVVLTRVS